MQSCAPYTKKRFLQSLEFIHQKEFFTFSQLVNQLPETLFDFKDIIARCGNFFLNSENSFSILAIPEVVFNFNSFNFSKYSSFVYCLFKMQYFFFFNPTQPKQYSHSTHKSKYSEYLEDAQTQYFSA